LAVLVVAVTPMQASAVQSLKLADVQAAVTAAGAKWTPGETSVSALSLQEARRRIAGLDPPTTSPYSLAIQTSVGTLQGRFDWRNVTGKDYTSPVRDQRACGSCYVFAVAAVVESLAKMGGSTLDLSEQFVLSCCPWCGNCEGGYADSVLELIRTGGVPDEACMPYQADDTVSCGGACGDRLLRVAKVDGWRVVGDMTLDNIKASLLTYGPLNAWMAVYQDFQWYAGGIYEHVVGEYVGGHFVTIVGYDDREGYWIVKNSWGTGWGENGWARIRYGDSGIDSSQIIYAWMYGVRPGDIAVTSIVIVNGRPALVGD